MSVYKVRYKLTVYSNSVVVNPSGRGYQPRVARRSPVGGLEISEGHDTTSEQRVWLAKQCAIAYVEKHNGS